MRKSVIPSRMKYGVYRSLHIFYLTGVQGRFLVSLEMTIPGKAVLSFSALETLFPSRFHTASALSAPSGHLPLEGKALGLLPPSLGRRCPEGAEVGSRSGMKSHVRQPASRFVIPSGALDLLRRSGTLYLRGNDKLA